MIKKLLYCKGCKVIWRVSLHEGERTPDREEIQYCPSCGMEAEEYQ